MKILNFPNCISKFDSATDWQKWNCITIMSLVTLPYSDIKAGSQGSQSLRRCQRFQGSVPGGVNRIWISGLEAELPNWAHNHHSYTAPQSRGLCATGGTASTRRQNKEDHLQDIAEANLSLCLGMTSVKIEFSSTRSIRKQWQRSKIENTCYHVPGVFLDVCAVKFTETYTTTEDGNGNNLDLIFFCQDFW